MPLRLTLMFACFGFIAITLALGLFSANQQRELGSLAVDTYDNALIGVNYIRKAQTDFLRLSASSTDPAKLLASDAGKSALEGLLQDLDVAIDRAITESGRSGARDIRAKVAAMSGPGTPTAITLEDIDTRLESLVDKYIQDGFVYRIKADELVDQTDRSLVYAMAAALFLALVNMVFLSHLIVPPIKRAVSIADAITAGRYDNEISKQGCDEVVRLLNSLGGMQDAIAESVRRAEALRITETARADAERARAAATAASTAKSEFLANMSHEIRTPINAILGMTELLLRSRLNDEQKYCADTVHQSVEVLLAIINDILDISKLEAGKVDLESVELNVGNIVESAVALMGGQAREKSLDLSTYVAPQAQGTFIGDPTLLRQVVLNLVSNAIKFTEKGAVTIQVMAKDKIPSDERGTSRLRFEIMDTGIGMSDETRRRLFEKFTQADNSFTRRFGGTGLGLAISKQLVEMMGGQIGVSSRLGVGTSFWFELPMGTAKQGAVAGEMPNLGKLSCLLIDDMNINLEILDRQLKPCGIRTSKAIDGVKAIAEIERASHAGQPYDVAIVDRLMPGLTGEDLAKRLTALKDVARPKLILLSSGGKDTLDSAAVSLFDAVLEKPVRQQALIDRIAVVAGVVVPIREHDPRFLPARATLPNEAGSMQPLRILLAEDNKLNHDFLTMLLEQEKHSVHAAKNGREAVEAIRANEFDVVLMDVQMPEMDGMEATRLIRAMAPPKCQTPIIMLTANAMQGARELYLGVGADDYVAKPIQISLLLSKLETITSAAAKHQPSSVTRSSPPPRDTVQAAPKVDRAFSHIEVANLEAIAATVAPKVLNQLLESYFESVGTLGQELEGHFNSKNFEALARTAHIAVSTSGNFGVMRAARLARELEQACLRKEFDAVGALLSDFHIETDEACGEPRHWQNSRLTSVT